MGHRQNQIMSLAASRKVGSLSGGISSGSAKHETGIKPELQSSSTTPLGSIGKEALPGTKSGL